MMNDYRYIIFKEKHTDRVFLFCNNNELELICKKIATERFEDGYYDGASSLDAYMKNIRGCVTYYHLLQYRMCIRAEYEEFIIGDFEKF